MMPFYDLIRDREVLTAILREVGGDTVAQAHAAEKGKTIKGVINDYLTGEQWPRQARSLGAALDGVPAHRLTPSAAGWRRLPLPTVRHGWRNRKSRLTPTPPPLRRRPSRAAMPTKPKRLRTWKSSGLPRDG
jgi:ParB family chromosome partitioning protein